MSKQLRSKILKDGLVKQEVITWSKELGKPIESNHQQIVEIGIDDLMKLIDQHTKEQITNVLDKLDNAIFSDGFPRMVLVKLMESIAEERKKLL